MLPLVRILSGVFQPDLSSLALHARGRALTPQMQKLARQVGPRGPGHFSVDRGAQMRVISPASHFALSCCTFVVFSFFFFSEMTLSLSQFTKQKTQPYPDVHSLIHILKSWGLACEILTGLEWVWCLVWFWSTWLGLKDHVEQTWPLRVPCDQGRRVKGSHGKEDCP